MVRVLAMVFITIINFILYILNDILFRKSEFNVDDQEQNES
jgi:hypothetical protein